MKCPISKYDIYGNYNTGIASSLMIVFEKCAPSKMQRCKSEQEITKWLEFKYIYTLVNDKKFIKHLFGEERILA